MELHPSDSLHGFTVRRIRQVPGKNAELVEMVFEKTGTELNWFKSKEPNKLFCIAFKTLPDDHTGVFHILEHSVLCGSEQYPVKEPFVELLKSSMNTFLNAMTYPDKTIYPVSSRNEQDYLNLAGVYLDAVFAPKILTNPNIFYQEGWHYETDGDALRLNGVVFNEMKGALSSMDDLIMENMQQMLFSDTAYGYNSGGDPQAIPTLTYEQFVATYRRNYHASNARVYLDGDIPLEKTLILLEQYLSRFEKQAVTGFEDQTPKAAEKTVYYEADPGEDLADKAQLMLGRIIGKWSEKTRLFAAHVLCDLLTDSNDAPLKRAILQAGLGQDVTAEVLDGIYQPFVALRIHNMNHARAGEVRALIEETLQKLVREGIDRQLLTASINRLAFELKDAQEPQGLGRCVDALDSWLYGGDPMLYLDCDEAIPALHAMCETGEFESLLEELFLKPEGLCVLHALPSLTYGEEMRAQEAAFLKAARDRMTAEQVEEIKQREAALRRWQQTPDDPKTLATLPVLDLAMISREPSMIEPAAFTAAGVPVLRHSIETNGIVHFNLYFALTPYSLEKLTRLSFAAVLLGKLPTRSHDAAALQNEIKTYIGRLDFEPAVLSNINQNDACTPVLCVHCSVLKENLAIAEKLVAEILTETIFHCPDRVRELLLQTETEAKQASMASGHRFAALCAQSHFSAQGAVNEAISAFSFIRFLQAFSKEFDARFDEFARFVESALAETVCKKRLRMSTAGDGTADHAALLAAFPEGEAAPETRAYQSPLPKALGIQIPAQVSFAGVGFHLLACGKRYSGTLRLLSNILSLSYLWNTVRVQGGAYGAGMSCRRGGGVFFYSFRDPTPGKTLQSIRAAADFVKEFCESDEPLDKFIISTVAATEPLLEPGRQILLADELWFDGFTKELAEQERTDMLTAAKPDLLALRELLKTITERGAVCVVGHQDALKACTDENLTIESLS